MTEQLLLENSMAGERIDALLPRLIPSLSRAAAQKLLDAGGVRLGGKPLRKNYRARGGETLEVTLPEPEPSALLPQALPLEIVYEDADLIVVNKPKGMVVHPAAGHPDGTLVNALLHHCGDSLSGIGGEKRPGIVHRIDKDTSGLLVAAKNDAAHRALAAQLANHSMFRIYDCVVCGRIRGEGGTVNAPIGRHPTERKRMAVLQRGGREAITHYEVRARWRDYTLLRCRLETGRTHQIRVHLAQLGHPLAGDAVYGRGREKALQGQCLHAGEIEFTHPRSGERMHFTCPLPDYFTAFLRHLGPPTD